MGYKNISISDDVYYLLASTKRKEESFNAFFLRALGPKKRKLTDFVGAWGMSDKELAEIQKDLRASWGSWDVRLRH